MRVAMMSYHKNAESVYKKEWIDEYKKSILAQEYNDFDVYEINYGNSGERIFDFSYYKKAPFENFVFVMNYLLDLLFNAGYDFVFNSNIDDMYSPMWVNKSLKAAIQGYDLVSSNFVLIRDDKIEHKHFFDKLDLKKELAKQHNIVCHPAVCYSKKFWFRNNRYIPDEIPFEDLRLWQRAINNSKFLILPEHLCYHRLHDGSVCKSKNR